MAGGQVVKLKREKIEACMTCPLCNKLLKEATTISLCLHTFCRKCIYEKLSDDDVDSCPVCNVDLGCVPVEKLRPDHNLQDIRAKIFPLKRRKVKAPEVIPQVPLPAKRKERSLSSLVVNTPKVLAQTGLTGRRTKSATRRGPSSCSSTFTVEERIKKDNDSAEDHGERSSSPNSHDKMGKRQVSSPDELSNREKPLEDKENVAELRDAKSDLWTPLNCLVEAANRTRTLKSNSQGLSLSKADPAGVPIRETLAPESKAREELAKPSAFGLNMPKIKTNDQKTRVEDDKNGTSLIPGQVKRRRIRAANQKKAAASEDTSLSAQLLLEAPGAKRNKRNRPIWFCLVACEDQKGEISLPQISASYLRIKDGTLPVSIIQKYLVKKLHLKSESEVEIMCRGQPVLPTLQLHHLVDLWFRTAATTKRVSASVGTSAKEFVMVLSYRRKVLNP